MEAAKRELDSNYVPIDFEAYSIQDVEMSEDKGSLVDDSKIWRISSLTAAVDADTKILLLPQPEAKRTKKFIDTSYNFKTVEDIFAMKAEIEKSMSAKPERFDEKTGDEIKEESVKKR